MTAFNLLINLCFFIFLNDNKTSVCQWNMILQPFGKHALMEAVDFRFC